MHVGAISGHKVIFGPLGSNVGPMLGDLEAKTKHGRTISQLGSRFLALKDYPAP